MILYTYIYMIVCIIYMIICIFIYLLDTHTTESQQNPNTTSQHVINCEDTTYYIVSLMRLGTILARKHRSCWLIIPAFLQHGVGYIWRIFSDYSSIKTHETHVKSYVLQQKIHQKTSKEPPFKLHDSMICGFPKIRVPQVTWLFHLQNPPCYRQHRLARRCDSRGAQVGHRTRIAGADGPWAQRESLGNRSWDH